MTLDPGVGSPCPCMTELAQRLLGARHGPITPYRLNATSADAQLIGPSAGLELVGFSLTETAGAAARLRILDGQGGSNDVELFDVALAANESSREWFASGIFDAGIPLDQGLFINRVSGSYKGTFFIRQRVT